MRVRYHTFIVFAQCSLQFTLRIGRYMNRNIKTYLNFLLVIIYALFIFCSQAAYAAYGFDKVRIELSLNQPVETLKLSNPGKDEADHLQITPKFWTQANGNDVYSSNKDLVVAPPIMKIQPGNTQIVRIGWRHPAPLKQELAYRIEIQDLTPITTRKYLIQFKVQASIPIFIRPVTQIFNPQWQVKKTGNTLQVILNNKGNIHVQVKKITLTNPNNEVVAEFTGSHYALAQQTVSIPLSVKKPYGNHLILNADTDGGKITTDVTISQLD